MSARSSARSLACPLARTPALSARLSARSLALMLQPQSTASESTYSPNDLNLTNMTEKELQFIMEHTLLTRTRFPKLVVRIATHGQFGAWLAQVVGIDADERSGVTIVCDAIEQYATIALKNAIHIEEDDLLWKMIAEFAMAAAKAPVAAPPLLDGLDEVEQKTVRKVDRTMRSYNYWKGDDAAAPQQKTKKRSVWIG